MPVAAAGIRVRKALCPIRNREEYGIWDGDMPLVPACAYLRSLEESERGQVETRAYQLIRFFRFLAGERFYEPTDPHRPREQPRPIDFWAFEWDHLRMYKSDLLRQVRATVVRTHRTGERSPYPRITHATADRYLFAAYDLFSWWARGPLTGRVLERTRRAPGAFSHLTTTYEARPDQFVIRTPRKFKRRRRKGLPLDVYNDVWGFLEAQMPPYPDILDRAAKTPAQKRRREAAERGYDLRMFRFHRNRALWAFMLATGFRVGEVVRIRADDFFQNVRTHGIYVDLKDRPEDGYLSEVKGPFGPVFIGHTPRFLQHIQAWRDVGLRYAALRRKATGTPEHPMLFSNDDGSPLTIGGVESLIDKINRALGIRERGHPFSPHVTRHTIATILRSGGVDLVFRQWFFRHSQPDTTEGYGSMFEDAVAAATARYETGGAR